ncbi:hypothetical protein mRhiFer1_008597 [Rhinolophus ferrumequinum]|uniref:Uncharacterized protein n=1 Tax=Rhinolophus ferrumequinum TaxID=59479 RepID=A0A7J7UJT8_RHIFE|nr:hypothetical protein mRhiFer1_008597 [Rhinolophus ferrumequinum]
MHTTLDTVNRFLSRLIALSMTFRYPSFCHIVLGSLPSVKVNQVRETRTGLLGFACVQRGRIPSVGGWTPFHIHLLFSSPSFLPPASSVTKQFCISNMGPGGSSFSSSFSHSVGCSCTATRLYFLLLLQQLSASWVPLASLGGDQ